jgi:hypothetical protein
LKEAAAANEMLQSDVAHWHQQAHAIAEDPSWHSVDLKFPPQLDASRHQLSSVWEAFEAALFQAKAARDDANEALPPVPVWAEEIRVARGGQGGQGGHANVHAVKDTPNTDHSAVSIALQARVEESRAETEGKPAKTPKVSNTKMDPAQRLALREAANQAVTGAMTVLAAENNEVNLSVFKQALKDHGRNVDTNMDLKVHDALIAAGDADGYGCERAWVVHGAGGLDELSTLGSNHVCVVEGSTVHETTVSPADAGLVTTTLVNLQGGDSVYNAGRLQALLAGQQDAYRDIVLFGAAAALIIAGRVQDLREGVAIAATAIDSGKARQTLDSLIRISNN